MVQSVIDKTVTFFFFQSSGDHRGLHSFPTRRSSDLAAHAIMQTPGIGCASAVLFSPRKLFAVPRGGQLLMDEHLDRKSTRLNSSHRCISYAVFCLKKKKQKNSQ